jgi:hypothetical protein
MTEIPTLPTQQSNDQPRLGQNQMVNPYESPDTSSSATKQVAKKPMLKGVAIASIVVSSVVYAFLFSPADPISFYLHAAIVLLLTLGSFWLGGRCHRTKDR